MVAPRGLTYASLRRIRKLWNQEVQRLTLAELRTRETGYGRRQDPVVAAARTHKEMKVRIAHRLRDFLLLPSKAMQNPSVRLLYTKYASAYLMHEQLPEPSCVSTGTEYWLALAQVFEEHQNVTRLLGHGRRQLVQLDPSLAPILDSFCDRFFISRIGTHLLGASFLHHVSVPEGARKPAGVAMGVLQPTNPAAFLRDLASSLTTSSRGSNTPVDFQGATDVSVLYVPGHLRVILRETLQNAMHATMLVAEDRHEAPSPVRVKVNRGQFGVFVTISDQGGGIMTPGRIWNWGRDSPQDAECGPGGGCAAPEGREPDDWSDSEAENNRPRLLPLGFGLPLRA